MGLREQNAARTRALVVEGAVALFLDRGFESTTMDDVARHVDVSPSTLYRYFATKEALALAPIGEPGLMAAELERRPETEDVGVCLGHALIGLLEEPRSDVVDDPRWRALLRESPRLSAQLLEWYRKEQALLVQALARRMHTTVDDVRVVLSATITTAILEMVADHDRPGRGGLSDGEYVRRLMRDVDLRALAVPVVPTPEA